MTGVLKRTSAAIVASIMVLFVVAATTSAQTTTGSGNGFRISPVRSEYVIEKGSNRQLVVSVENPTDASVVAQPVVNNFISNEIENGEPRLILDDSVPAPKNNFKSLVEVLPDINLGPREKKDVNVNIRVPENANSGGYYGAIRFVPASATGAGNVGLTASVGTIVLVRVPGNLTERLDLLELTAGQNGRAKSFFTSGDVSVLTRLKNSGDIHVQPFGKVQVKNMFGAVVAEYELNNVEPRANILPDSIRKFDDSLSKPSKGWIGRYTISANLGYSQGGGELISSSATFWYLPAWSLIVLALLVIGVAAGGYFLYRRLSVPKTKHGKK
ncbi:DUF916 domain-containing protein [Candidatus Saccharibacteria bacterium]|nr:DUF916 domain-containing protein [Candidatus Saccharibacteria bacterium]